MAAQLMEQMEAGGYDVRALMDGAAPTCLCVKMAPDGSCEELSLDMTPKAQSVQKALGGGVTFVGQWEPLGVFLVAKRDDAGLELFQGELPKPFDAAKGKFRGAVLMTRTAEDGTPADFSLEEFEAFRAKAPEPWQDYPEEEEEEEAEGLERILEDDGSDEDSDADEMYDSDAADADERAAQEEDEEDDDGGALRDMLVQACLEKFTKDNGREPTEEEAKNIVTNVLEKLGATLDDMAASSDEEEDFAESSDEEEDDEGDEEAEAEDEEADDGAVRALLLQKCTETFVTAQGREPNADEMKAIEASVDAKLESPDEAAAGEALVVDKIVQHFTAAHGRAPEPAEVEDVLQKLAAAEEAREAAAEEPEAEEAAEAAEDEAEPDILGQLVELFKQQNGRDPTEEEMNQWRETLAAAAADAAEEAEAGAAAALAPAKEEAKPLKRVNESPPGPDEAKKPKVSPQSVAGIDQAIAEAA